MEWILVLAAVIVFGGILFATYEALTHKPKTH